MNAQQESIARTCIAGAESGTLSFPQILGLMGEAGLEAYLVDYRQATSTYYAASGEAIALPIHRMTTPVAAEFDATRVHAAIVAAQTQAPGYTYLGFSQTVAAAGCAGYLVSLPGRRVVYFGRTGETHVEHFPGTT